MSMSTSSFLKFRSLIIIGPHSQAISCLVYVYKMYFDRAQIQVSLQECSALIARRFLGMTKMPLLPIRKLPEISWNGQVS